METPYGISGNPCFGWQLDSNGKGATQSAYQVVVTSNQKEVWNSGKVISDQSQLIRYDGNDLLPGERYVIQLSVWDQSDQEVKTSSWFETAPEKLQGQWIGAITRAESNLPKGRGWHSPSLKKNREFYDSIPEQAKRSIMLRKEVMLQKEIRKARIHISGLGHYELSLNGKKVGNSEFAPLWTDYDQSVFYNTYDVTNSLQTTDNAIGVMLGNGMYNVIGDRYRKFWVSFGPPTLLFQLNLEYEDGSKEVIKSDESWKYAPSPITFNDIFGGEDYNAQLEQEGWNTTDFDDSEWKAVVVQEAPKGTLKPQLAPAVKIQKAHEVVEYKQVDSSTYVFNMKQNLAGFPSIRVKGKAGTKIKLIVGERINEEGYVTQKSTGGPHYYEYTLKGEGVEEWQPRFSYYGYQYIQAEGVSYKGDDQSELPELVDLKSSFIYADAEPIGSFECSNEIFTKTHHLINNAIKSNMQAVFTDCPHREKLGWIEEIHLNGPGLLYNYDLTQSLAKSVMDMADAQRENGLVPNIAPEYVDFSKESWGADFTDSPEWGAAVVMVPWQYYEFYGDDQLIRDYYPVMRDYVDYLTTRADSGIVSHGLGDWYDYGEHGAGYGKNSPISISATSHYYLCIMKLLAAAKLVGNDADIKKYQALAQEIKTAFNREFYNKETNQYATGSQFSNAAAIYLDLVERENRQRVLDNLVADIKAHGNRLTTGDVGNRYLFQTLADNGLNDLLFEMMNHYEAPGYGFQVKYGLTTLTEQWDPERGNSWNHFMLGQIEEWFFKSLAGIKPDPDKPGFKQFFIEPELAGDLTFVNASTASLYGEISVNWKIEDDQFNINIAVPVNSTATFVLPEEIKAEERSVQLVSGNHSLSYSLKRPGS
ncbi:MAG: family 78 glycoside hydrolase catalytic domain [Marinoscillum sp.]